MTEGLIQHAHGSRGFKDGDDSPTKNAPADQGSSAEDWKGVIDSKFRR